MKRRLVLLNLVLLALLGLAGWQLRRRWVAAQARQAEVLRRAVRAVPPPPLTPRPAPGAVAASSYIDIAEKALPFRDRNSNVIVDVAPPPPPKPVPPLPTLLGIMNLGDGPSAVLVEKAGAPNREYKPGDLVGEFKVVAIHQRQVELSWEDKTFTREIEALQQVEPEPDQVNERRAAAPAPQPAPVMRQAGPGVDVGRGIKACVPNDSTPVGTVVDGVRKMVTSTPFGDMCRWEPVNQAEGDRR